MRDPASPRERSDRSRSELASLVEIEARLDRELAAARAQAALLEQQAKRRVDDAAAALASELAERNTHIAEAVDRAAIERMGELEATAARELARLAAVRDGRAEQIARRIAEQLVTLVLAEDAP